MTTTKRTRFAITHLHKNGLRGLTLANQGRNHYDTRAEALAALAAFMNPEHGLDKVLDAAEYSTLRVDPIECYDHGDAVGIWVDD
jgi:hypothetical protein